jgi:hypothetical protein
VVDEPVLAPQGHAIEAAVEAAVEAPDSDSSSSTVQATPPPSDDEEQLDRHPELRHSMRAGRGQLDLSQVQHYGRNTDRRYNLVFALLATALLGATVLAQDLYEPKTLLQARQSGSWERWYEAIKQELTSLVSNKTWVLVPRPSNRKVLGGKWVYKLKRGPNREILRYKARWVVQGFG